ncbi:MAG TPA: homoserine O-acetyltransferase [Steroidobacteraceae bacterium]|nr:homoserine O-acetyltransferase [Steroidobacteraceae bacterium]
MSAFPPESASAARRVPLPAPFRLQAGGELWGAEVAVETYGRLSPARDNAVLIFTGLSASAHAAAHAGDPTPGWWESMIGPGKALDTERLFVISVNSLGSCFGSTGPGSIDPATALPYGSSFPELRVEDIARASQAAVDSFGIERLYAVVGASLGGMTALAHAVAFPGKARRLISISGALAAGAAAIATRSLQREILGTALKSGADAAAVAQAMRWARKIGVLSYVGKELLEERFGREQTEPFAGRPSGTAFEVEHWLEHLAQKFLKQFNPWAYWYISRAMDLFDFGAHEGAPGGDAIVHHHDASDVARSAARLQLERALIVGVHEDLLFPLAQQHEVAAVLRGAGIDTELVELHSPYGHDAFLTEAALFTPVLGAFLPQAPGSATSHPSHRALDSLCR